MGAIARKKLITQLRIVTGGEEVPTVVIKTKCTPRITAQFCELLIRGLPPDACCDYLGVSAPSFWKWMRRGELYNAAAQLKRTDTDSPFGYFVKEIKRALAEYRLKVVDKLHAGGDKNWYQWMAILERRDRKSFGRFEPQGGQFEDYDPDEQFM